jgi:exosortase/archaeosortase family protein
VSAAAAVGGGRVVTGTARRRLTVLVELVAAVAICLAGYYLAAGWFRVQEAKWTVAALDLIGVDDVSGVLPGSILMYRGPGDVLEGVVTTSCSSILTVVGLSALTVSVLRKRRAHAFFGLAVALVAVVVANGIRLVLSSLAGLWWGAPAMTLFHDWVGTIWTLASTLGGFLLMVCLTLPAAERAEQDVAGRHTARRPSSWARPGLGYRVAELEERTGGGGRRRSLTGYVHRYLLPGAVSRRLAARREAGRIDYRIGHQHPVDRIATVRRLVADGLGAHTASLLAVATYDEDPEVLDALADAIAARQWEPVTNDRIAAVRLWARGWLLARRLHPADELGAADDETVSFPPVRDVDDDTLVIPTRRSRPPVPASPNRPAARRARPRSFARPRAGSAQAEDLR